MVTEMNKPTVAHIEGETTNKTIGKLRWATNEEQQRIKGKRLNTTSKSKGVRWSKHASSWHSSFNIYIYIWEL